MNENYKMYFLQIGELESFSSYRSILYVFFYTSYNIIIYKDLELIIVYNPYIVLILNQYLCLDIYIRYRLIYFFKFSTIFHITNKQNQDFNKKKFTPNYVMRWT